MLVFLASLPTIESFNTGIQLMSFTEHNLGEFSCGTFAKHFYHTYSKWFIPFSRARKLHLHFDLSSPFRWNWSHCVAWLQYLLWELQKFSFVRLPFWPLYLYSQWAAEQAVPRFWVPVTQHALLPQLSLKELNFFSDQRGTIILQLLLNAFAYPLHKCAEMFSAALICSLTLCVSVCVMLNARQTLTNFWHVCYSVHVCTSVCASQRQLTNCLYWKRGYLHNHVFCIEHLLWFDFHSLDNDAWGAWKQQLFGNCHCCLRCVNSAHV